MKRPALMLAAVAMCGAFPVAAQILLPPITRPNFEPHAVAVYETGNRVFVADNDSGNIFMYHGTTHAELAATFVGRGTADIAVHEASGKLYAVEMGSRRLVVLDASTGAFLHAVSGTYSNRFAPFVEILIDQSLGKVWVYTDEGLRQIDVATDVPTTVPGVYGQDMDLNPLTHELFIATYLPAKLWAVNGSTLAVTLLLENYPALGIGVNWQENRVYLSSGTAASIVSYDRDTALTHYVAQNDAVTTLVYDPVHNRVITGAEVNSTSTIIEGDDTAFNLPIESGTAWVDVRRSTGHVYYVRAGRITVVDQATQTVQVFPIPDDPEIGGSMVDIAINQSSGRVYIIADAAEDFVTVFQDTEKLQRPPLFLGSTYSFWMRMIDPATLQVVDTYTDQNPEGLHLGPGGGRLYTRSVHSGGTGSVSVFAGTGVDRLDRIAPIGINLFAIASSPTGASLYVSGSGPSSAPGELYVIDPVTHAMLATIPVGIEPRGMAVTPDGAKIFVANRGSDNVAVVSTTANAVIALVPVGDGPAAIAIHPAGRKAYVRNSTGGTVSVVDVVTHAVLATIPVGTTLDDLSSSYLALSADGKYAYVTNESEGTVSVIDTGTYTVLATLAISAGTPKGIAAKPDGTAMYVVAAQSSGPSSLVTVDTATRSMVVTQIVTTEFGGTTGAADLVASDPFARFAGRVIGSGGAPLSGATVRALQNGVESGRTTTNAAGDYAIPALLAGTYDIEFSKSGSSTTVAAQVALTGRITHVDATLGPCTVMATPSFANYSSAGATAAIAISAAPGCEWTATAGGFLSISGGASGSGNGTITVQVASNDGPGARTGTITVGEAAVTITQAGNGASSPLLDAAAAGSQVLLTWTGVAGASSYEVTRSAAGSAFVSLGTTAGPSFTDTAVAGGFGYLYRVIALAPSPIAYSNVDLAVVFSYADPIVNGVPIRAIHIAQLREAVNAARAALARSAAGFTDPTLAGAAIKRIHMIELRTAVDAIRAATGLAPIAWTDATLTPGVSIVRVAHLAEARDALR